MYTVHTDGTQFPDETAAVEYAQRLADSSGETQRLYPLGDDLTGADYLSVEPTPQEEQP